MVNLRDERTRRGMKGTYVAERIGISKQALSAYETGKRTPPDEVLMRLAQLFGVSVEYLKGETRKKEPDQIGMITEYGLKPVPIVGWVHAGYGHEAVEEFTGDYYGIPGELLRGYPADECRVLKVVGDSMYPLILEGDTVVIHVQPDVETGEIAVVLTDDEATVKRVIKSEGGTLMLVPQNQKYETRIIGPREDVHIYGRVIQIVRAL